MNAEIGARLAQVRARVESAARRAGRDPAGVRVVAVGKGHPADALRAAVAAGCVDLGENYVQELVAKQETEPLPAVRWHFVGPLQRNKVRQLVGRIFLLHTLDSVGLAAELEKRAAAQGTRVEVLCQVNVGREQQKHGVAPEALPELLAAAAAQPHLAVRGLMTLPPAASPEETRPHFRALRELAAEMRRRFPELPLPELSMGMTGDFEVAIEEGATLVRIGTAIFGERPAREKTA